MHHSGISPSKAANFSSRHGVHRFLYVRKSRLAVQTVDIKILGSAFRTSLPETTDEVCNQIILLAPKQVEPLRTVFF